jgi:hypothetical protein
MVAPLGMRKALRRGARVPLWQCGKWRVAACAWARINTSGRAAAGRRWRRGGGGANLLRGRVALALWAPYAARQLRHLGDFVHESSTKADGNAAGRTEDTMRATSMEEYHVTYESNSQESLLMY